jgi:hypothetical protein
MLSVWRIRNQGLDWQAIGEQLKLNPSFAASPDDDEDTAKEKRLLMSITTHGFIQFLMRQSGMAQ